MQDKPSLEDTLALMRDLRARCEWDRAQTHESLRPYLIEETHELDDALAVALVSPLDLGPEPGAKTLLGRQLDPVLGCECAGELRPGDEAELDDRLAETLSRHLLLGERALEVVTRQQTLLDEQSSEGAPGDVGRFHRLTIGIVALRGKECRAKCLYRGRSSGSRRVARMPLRCRGRG